MSYCVQCGVELSDYHKECPLCNTLVVNPTGVTYTFNTDYPDYRVISTSDVRRVKRYVTGTILSVLFFVYSVITLIIDVLVSKSVTWSLIPITSLALLWITVAYPFFRRRNSFFRLFTYSSIAVILYLLSLNYILSQDFIWSRYTTVSIMIVWVVIAGIFITDRIRKFLPVTIFYSICTVILSIAMFLFIDNRFPILNIALPIGIAFFILSFISYFVVKAASGGTLVLLIVLLVSVSILCIVIDATVYNHILGKLGLTWSIIVNAVTIPIISVLFSIKKGKELRLMISKKLHR